MTSLSIYACFCWRIYLQSATWSMGMVISWPKTSCTGLLHLAVWYVHRTAKATVARIHIHGSESSTYVSCRLYVRTIFPSTLCIISTIVYAYGFPGDTGLVLISYSFYIKLFLKSLTSNSTPRSYVLSTGRGYQTRQIVSTKFANVIAFLSLYCVNWNHPLTGSIIVTDFKIKPSFLFLHIL